MRPINKGRSPRAFNKYQESQPDLIARLGRFCSYCERDIRSGIAVEHKRPKKKYPAEELNWDNFLLSCPNCNSNKLDRKVKLRYYLWPDSDNTFRAFEYTPGGIVRVRRGLSKKLRHKANKTIYLLGLDRHPGAFRKPTDRDYRWQDRREQWEKAVLAQQQLNQYDTPSQRQLIVRFAEDGIFSIWMEVFKDDTDMCNRLIRAFPGTALDCFDAMGRPMPRPGGQL